MAFPAGTANPERVPMNVLFPESYAQTKQMIVRDFAMYFGATVTFVVAMVALYG